MQKITIRISVPDDMVVHVLEQVTHFDGEITGIEAVSEPCTIDELLSRMEQHNSKDGFTVVTAEIPDWCRELLLRWVIQESRGHVIDL